MPTTPNRGYQTPDPTVDIADDVYSLIDALLAIDADMTAVLLSLAQKAALVHGHAIGDVEGLTAALGGKMSASFHDTLGGLANVDPTADTAPSGSIIYKGPNNVWLVGNPVTVLGAHLHPMTQIEGLELALDSKLTASDLPATLAAYTTKGTPVDADSLLGIDSASSNTPKRFLFSAIWAYIKAKADAIYSAVGHTHTFGSLTSKPTTLAGYGITDAASINHGHGWSEITGKPAETTSTAGPSGGVDGDKWFQV